MSKQKKKPKKKRYIASPEEYNAAKGAVNARMKTFHWKLALTILGLFAVLAAVYYLLLAMHVIWATPALYTLAAVLFMTFFFVNRGFSKDAISREILSDTWSEQRKDAFIENDRRRKALGRKIMVVMVPVLLLVMVDMLILLLLPLLTGESNT